MHGIGPMPHAGCGTQANAMAGGMPVGMRPNAAYGGGHGFQGSISDAEAAMLGLPTGPPAGLSAMAPLPTAERFIKANSGGVLLDKAGSPAGPIPEGSFVDAKEGKLYGADGKAIAVPQGGSFSFFEMPDVATLVSAYKATESLHATVAQGGKGTMPGTMPPHQHPMTAVDGQWGPGGVTALKGGGKGAMPGCDDHGATRVGGASGMPVGMKGGGPAGLPTAQMLAQLTHMMHHTGGPGMPGMPGVPGMPGMVAGVNGGGALDAMASTGALGGMPGLQHSLHELVQTLRSLTMALQKVEGGGPATKAAPAKVEEKPATETSTSTTTTATAGASGSGTKASTSTDDSSSSTSTDASTSTSTSTST